MRSIGSVSYTHLHADSNLLVSSGTIKITESYEGLEGLSIDITGGDIELTSSDDGLNAAGGNDSSGVEGLVGVRRGADEFTCLLYTSVTGGVTEAVLRRVSTDKTKAGLVSISYQGIRGMEGVKVANVNYGDRQLKIAVVSGLNNAEKVIDSLKAGEHYDMVEVMACPGDVYKRQGRHMFRFCRLCLNIWRADKMVKGAEHQL